MKNDEKVGVIKPFSFYDRETKTNIKVSLSQLYTTIKINGVKYYFIRETGEFDGIGEEVSTHQGTIH